MEQPHQTILIYSLFHVRPVPERDLSLAATIDRDDALRFLLQLKVATTRPAQRNIEHPFIQYLIAVLPDQTAARLYQLLSSPALGEFITHPVVINQLIADLLARPQAAEQQQLPETEFAVRMLDVVMLYNEHHFKSLKILGRPDDHELVWEMNLMQNRNAVNPSAYVRNGISKQLIFFAFLKEKLGERYSEFEALIAQKTGLQQLPDLIHYFIRLQIEQDKLADTVNPLLTLFPDHPLYHLFIKLGLVLDPDQLKGDPIDELYVRPFLRLRQGQLCLMGTNDFGLITDKGWHYQLLKLGRLKDFLPKVLEYKDLQGYLGFHYYEKFLLGKVFRSLHKTGFRVIPSDDLKTPDFTLIHNERDIFIIEVKSAAMHYRIWKEQDLAGLKKEIYEKYLSPDTGVIQLHKNLKHLAKDPVGLFQLRTPLKKLRIYPVLIYTEPHIGTAGINDYMIQYGPQLTAELASQFQSVMPLTLIHYDFFLENLEVIRADKTILKDSVTRYHEAVRDRKKAYTKFQSTLNYMRAMVSFDTYAACYKGIYQLDQNKIAAALRQLFLPPDPTSGAS